MKISFIVHDISNNAIIRAYLLAGLLYSNYEIEILGYNLGDNSIKRYEDKYKIVELPYGLFNLKKALQKIDGDMIYCVKPKTTSFGLGLLKKICCNKKLILDIDDSELAFFDISSIKKLIHHLRQIHINNFISTFIFEKIRFLADLQTVSSRELKKKFGGYYLPQVKDTELFNPDKYDKTIAKQKLNLQNKKIIMFSGTPRIHKGIDLIIKAIQEINDSNIVFVIIDQSGNFTLPDYPWIKKIPPQPMDKIPEFLVAADLVILPQNSSEAAARQVPAKLIDAMAMAIPIISTNVSDIPSILKDCGIIINPNNLSELVSAIKTIFDKPNNAKQLGLKARKKCIEEFSLVANKSKIIKLLHNI